MFNLYILVIPLPTRWPAYAVFRMVGLRPVAQLRRSAA